MHSTSTELRTPIKEKSTTGLVDAPKGKIACVMRSFSLKRKFALVLSALLLPLALLTVLFVKERYAAIQFTKTELSGLPYLTALHALTEAFPQFRTLVRETREGIAGAAEKVASKREEVVANIAEIERIDAQYGNLITSTQSWHTFTAEWTQFLGQQDQLTPTDAETRLSRIMGYTHEIRATAGSKFGLILDPDIDSYQLVDLSFNRLPVLPEKLEDLRRAASLISGHNATTDLEKIALANILNENRELAGDIARNVQAVADINAEVASRLDANHRELQSNVTAFVTRVEEQLAKHNGPELSYAEIMQLSTAAISAALVFNNDVREHLAALLHTRLDKIYPEIAVDLGVVFIALLIAMFLYNRVTHSIIDPLKTVKAVFQRLAAGQFNNKIAIQFQDEIGDVLRQLASMQAKLGADRDAMQRRNLEIGSLKAALDSASVGVMVADANAVVTYVNPALNTMLQRYHGEFSTHLPQVNLAQLVGSRLEAFQTDSAQAHHLIANLNSTRSIRSPIGTAVFDNVLNPIRDESGKRVGIVMEWADRTTQTAVEAEVHDVVNAVMKGDLRQRVPLEGKEGFLLSLATDINALTQNVESVIDETNDTLSAVAQGDLRRSADSSYEGAFDRLKCNVNTTIVTLTDMITKIRSAAEEVKNGSTEIAQANLDLSQRTEEQAANLQVSASNITELSQIVRTNVENAHHANQLATQTREQAEQGGNAVRNAVIAMSQINASSAKMEDIIGAIDELAFQTNLLALNAAVEAARAGDQGRGFAVVANEVRTLAQRSAAAAREIKDLIEDSRSKVHNGTQLVNDSGQALERIIVSVKQVGDRIAEISSGGDEQLAGIDQASNAIHQIDDATQQNAALVEETAAASKALGDQAHNLTTLVGFFKVAEGGTLAAKRDALVTQTTTKGAVERRSAARPWNSPNAAAPTAPKQAPRAVANDSSGEWETF